MSVHDFGDSSLSSSSSRLSENEKDAGLHHALLLIQDLNVRIVNAITGELLRELTIDPERDYQPRT